MKFSERPKALVKIYMKAASLGMLLVVYTFERRRNKKDMESAVVCLTVDKGAPTSASLATPVLVL